MNLLNLLKLWPVPVLLFCLYSLYALVEESYEVLYQQKRNETDPIQFLACKELCELFPGQTEIDLKELRDDLYDRFNSSDDYGHDRGFYPEEFELTLNRTKSGGYLVLNGSVCFIARDLKELDYFDCFLSPERLFAIKNDTLDFIRIESPWDQIEQLIVRKKERPYSDCNQSNGRFFCLHECFRRFRLARYLYNSSETGRILLDYSHKTRTIKESERTCFEECKRENCKIVQLTLIDKSKNLKEPKIFEAEPVLSELDFWVEFIGRFFLLFGLFFDQFASIAIKLAKSRIRRRKVKVVLFYLNLAIVLLNLAYSGYLCVGLVLDYNAEVSDLPEREMTRNLIYPKTVHLAICVPTYLEDINGKTMLEIEKATDGGLDDTLEGIYVREGNRSYQTDFHVHQSKILFFRYKRCFLLSIYLNYRTIPSRPMLTVRLKKDVFSYNLNLYILSERENLTSKSFEYSGGLAFQKRIIKRLKSMGRCVNYEDKPTNCTGRQNCVERCITRKFIGRHNRTTFGVDPYPMTGTGSVHRNGTPLD